MKNRSQLIEALQQHSAFDVHEAIMLQQMIDFVQKTPGAYHRENLEGHLTASGWIVNADLSKVLLLHHAKLGKWLQPGGHADGNKNLIEVVRAELQEETGITGFANPQLFDIDIHTIPARGDVPQHLHYDVRFLVQIDEAQSIQRNEESNELAWFPVQAVMALNNESSISRMVQRTIEMQAKQL
jgi:8-oxo-dGTP pyrophosphatase MutT (NUDIX family)